LRDPLVSGMAAVRFVSAALEATAATLMLRAGRVEAALRINGVLGLVGPLVLIAVTGLGLVGLSSRVPLDRLLLVLVGVYLILYGTR
jgi:hypothetical protein